MVCNRTLALFMWVHYCPVKRTAADAYAESHYGGRSRSCCEVVARTDALWQIASASDDIVTTHRWKL